MIIEKNLDRIRNYREDDKRYKSRSPQILDDVSVRLAQKVNNIEVDDPFVDIINFLIIDLASRSGCRRRSLSLSLVPVDGQRSTVDES